MAIGIGERNDSNELEAASEDLDRSVCRTGLLEMRAEAPGSFGASSFERVNGGSCDC